MKMRMKSALLYGIFTASSHKITKKHVKLCNNVVDKYKGVVYKIDNDNHYR